MPMNAEAAAEVFGADDVFPMSEVRTASMSWSASLPAHNLQAVLLDVRHA